MTPQTVTAPKTVPREGEPPVQQPTGEVSSASLASDVERLQREEQVLVDRERQQELARQRELARFD